METSENLVELDIIVTYDHEIDDKWDDALLNPSSEIYKTKSKKYIDKHTRILNGILINIFFC